MTESQLHLLQEAQAYVTELFATKVSKSVRFHTLEHTQDVVNACEKLADHYQVPDDERLALYLGAWFHDTGYTGGQAKDHESVSVQHSKEFLSRHNSSHHELINKVIGCINATRMPQTPATTIERIICDADLFHLGTDAFKEKARLLREEIKELGDELPKKEWLRSNIEFLETHKYFTTFGREKLQPLKEIHLAELKEKVKDPKTDKKEKLKDKDKEKITTAAELAAKEKLKKEKANQTERGIATVFRIMAQTQSNLSQMADSKANILISVNSIILSIIISVLFTKLESNPNLLIPVIILVFVCVSTIVISILATRPNISSGTFTREDISNKKTNLLFFGNFYKMNLPDYDWAMMEMLNDKNYLYGSIVKDNYFLGVVLAKKYRLLRIAYNVFMFGLILAMIAFALFAFVIPPPQDLYTPGY